MAAKRGFELGASSDVVRDRLRENTKRMRSALEAVGFAVKPGQSPILPVMIGDAALAVKLADALLSRSIYVIAFSYPVVPQGQARIRIQVSAAHTLAQLDRAATAFVEAGKALQ